MKAHLFPALLGLSALCGVRGSVLEARNCHANNCAREITGTDAHITPDLTSRLADCSAYMTATVIPPAATANDRTVPDYATPFCSDTTEYSSVCACAGITEVTITGSGLPISTSEPPNDIPSSVECDSSTSTPVPFETPIPSSSASSSSSSPTSSEISPSSSRTRVSSSRRRSTTSVATSSATSSIAACISPLVRCAATNTCTNLKTDEGNCGTCGKMCLGSETCYLGNCTITSELFTRCNNPANCDEAGQFGCQPGCGGSRGYCQPDVTGQGRCRSESNNPECRDMTNCTANAECPGGFCIISCCESPTCYYLADNSFCSNATVSLSGKRAIGLRSLGGGLPMM